MTPLRWSEAALGNIDAIGDYIGLFDYRRATAIIRAITARAELLQDFPLSGEKTAMPNVRKVSIPRYRYIILYEVAADEVIILGVRHTAQNWRG